MTTLYKLPPADRLMLAATQLQMAAESAMEWRKANQEEIPILTDSDILAAAERWTISNLDDDRFHGDYEGLKETLYVWVEGQLS